MNVHWCFNVMQKKKFGINYHKFYKINALTFAIFMYIVVYKGML